MGLSRTVSEINGENCKQIFLPRCSPTAESRLKGFGSGAQKTRMTPLRDCQKFNDNMSIPLCRILELNPQTDGQTDGIAKIISRSACIACWRAFWHAIKNNRVVGLHRFDLSFPRYCCPWWGFLQCQGQDIFISHAP